MPFYTFSSSFDNKSMQIPSIRVRACVSEWLRDRHAGRMRQKQIE